MQLSATVATVLVHTAMYAIYLQLHCTSLYVFKRKDHSNPRPIIYTSMVLFALITVQWALTIADTFAFFEATRYLSIDEITSDSPTIYDGPHGRAKIALYIAQTIVGDGFFAYRLYLVWGRRWRVLIALVLFILSFTAFGILSLVSNSFLNYIVTWPMFSSTVMANIIITGMITFKVWKTTRASAALFSASYSTSGPMSHTWSILQTLLESAGLYTLGVILTAVSPLFSGNSFGAFLSAMGPLIGIAFSLILLLAGLGRTAENSSNAMAPTLLVFHHSNADSDD
ncbi:hypothetical protein EYR38_009153 [Pleurotus pulmonarius]|nr:hypothetical protein EYR38_009153 [Pleurotus pulmonarius]